MTIYPYRLIASSLQIAGEEDTRVLGGIVFYTHLLTAKLLSTFGRNDKNIIVLRWLHADARMPK
jgi:hypothetical protein